MVDIRESPSGPLVAAGGETGVTLTSVRYVDPATELDPENQTGSELAPFATLQQAIDSIAEASLTNATIVCIDGDYGEAGAEYAPVEDDILQIVGFGSAQNIGAFVIAGGSGSSRLTFRNLSVSPNVFSFQSNTTGGTYEFFDMIVSGVIDTLNSTTVLVRTVCDFVIQTSFLVARDCVLLGSVVASSGVTAVSTTFEGGLSSDGGSLTNCIVSALLVFLAVESTNFIRDCRLAGIQSGGATFVYDSSFTGTMSFLGLVAYSSRFEGNLDAAADAEFNDCLLTGEVFTGGNLVASGCTFTGTATFANQSLSGTSRFISCVATVTNNLAGDTIVMKGCFWPGAIVATTALQLLDTFMYVDSGPATLSSPGQIQIEGSRLAGDVSCTNLIIDTVSWQQALSGGVTFTQTTRQIADLYISAAISIVVPAVAAGAVGYVNTTLVGTDLEGIFVGANEPVTVNPQTDLVAAGAGGGFLNARINAADSIRCAFVGPLAGGAANFTVTRAR